MPLRRLYDARPHILVAHAGVEHSHTALTHPAASGRGVKGRLDPTPVGERALVRRKEHLGLVDLGRIAGLGLVLLNPTQVIATLELP